MPITSIPFAIFAIISAIIYFAFPKKEYRWVVLLIASSFFYVYNSFRYAAFILVSIITIYLAACKIDDLRKETKAFLKTKKDEWSREERKAYKENTEKKCRRVLTAALLLNFGILFVLKYFNFMSGSIAAMLGGSAESAPQIKLLLPLGISFYTFIATGYLIDVYRETIEQERNIFKFALFVSFFPQIVQGPISSYSKLHHQLITPHNLEWMNFKHGIMLIGWGLFKKIVIADRIWIAIKAYNENGGIHSNTELGGYGGTVVLFVTLLYAIQLYADFSGGMDIARGLCQVLGIKLELNFRQPYFSKSISEYWRRWHITLGAWMKNYVFYPIAMSPLSAKISKGIAGSKFGQTPAGKHISKVLMTAVASFIVFLLVGIWHGANSKFIAFGIWNGFIIMLSALLEPVYGKTRNALHIKDSAWWWQLFQMFRTFLIVLVGYVFDISESFTNAMNMLRLMITDHSKSVFLKQLTTLGLSKAEYAAILVCVLVLLYFSIRLERLSLDSPSELIERLPGALQWFALFMLLLCILMIGVYGPMSDPADFIYMQF